MMTVWRRRTVPDWGASSNRTVRTIDEAIRNVFRQMAERRAKRAKVCLNALREYV